MRRATLCICSTAHLTLAERADVDARIAAAPRDALNGRLRVDHPVLTIEAHQYGSLVHTGVVFDHPDRPEEVAPALWSLVERAFARQASWLLFDCDEPPDPALPAF